MGGKRVTQRRLEVVEVDAERNLLLVKGAVPGPQATARSRCGATDGYRSAATKAPVLGKQAKADLPAGVFGEELHESLVQETARADMAARRRGTASTLGRGEVAMTTRQGLATEGHRPRARRAR